MLNICSLFQKFFGFIKSIQKKTYRTCMVIVSGIMLVSVICLSAKDFGGSGKNKAMGNAESKVSTLSESDTEDDDTDANAVVQNLLFSYGNTGEDENSKELLAYNRISQIVNKGDKKFEKLPSASIVPVSTELLGEQQESSNETTKTSETDNQTEAENKTEAQTEAVEETTVTENVTETQPEPQTEAVTEAEPETVEQVINTPIDIELSDSDYYWLIRIVEAEAGDQDEIGRIMVANVIFNRVKSGKFPSTVKSVIFQNNGRTYQFEPVKNERIYDVTPSETTINCVDRAISGEDYSRGALFFTMKTSSRSWFNTSLTLLFVHGDHYFYTY
ncbi:MAG: cell wall hydrolase [Lachnospiraceae bacterium]|nr:cell wall hydrolase [Clostridiales bacterium]MDD6293722.1 cell wall hydrolase [Eubacteriales bacterium]MDY2606628.1 cell wall hydrolase [Lachnospiraceae bacterium]